MLILAIRFLGHHALISQLNVSCFLQEFLPLLKKAAGEAAIKEMSCRRAAIINITSKLASIERGFEVMKQPMYPYRASKVGFPWRSGHSRRISWWDSRTYLCVQSIRSWLLLGTFRSLIQLISRPSSLDLGGSLSDGAHLFIINDHPF